MLSRAFTKPNKRNPKHGENSSMSQSIMEDYEDCIVGFMEDSPLILCGGGDNEWVSNSPPTLREVLRASAGVMGESCLGMTEKVVFLGGKVCALKRFREVRLRKLEFGRRIERVAQISRNCEYLVPVSAYLFSKRIKVVLCDYYPMGSLADLLAENSSMSQSIMEDYEDCIVGFMEDSPLILCGGGNNEWVSNSPPTLREVLRASVGVMGESCLGMTEKVVFLGGKVCALKRFREVRLRKLEFGRRIERVARISRNCEYLVPVSAYLFSKRIKLVLCDYYPMGSLADLLAGGRVYGHTSLEWNQRVKIISNIARAISFIHSLSPPKEKKMQMNVHGNLKSSNIMINIDFSACLSNYGFVQLSECVEFSNTGQRKPSHVIADKKYYCRELSQKGDIYNFGVILFDILGLGGHEFLGDNRKCILEKKEQIKDGTSDIIFECDVEGKERLQAVEIMEIALSCTDKELDRRPTIEDVLKSLRNALSISIL